MAITYTGSAGVFSHLGKLIARLNGYGATATGLGADLVTLVTAFGTTWLPEEGVASFYLQLQQAVTAWRQGVASFADRRVLDQATVLSQLSVQLDGGSGLQGLLPALRRQMVIDGQTVKASACTVGAASLSAGAAGNGMAYATRELDGYNSPLLGGLANVAYLGLQSQLCVPSETMTLECVADSAGDYRAPGGESWTWIGSTAYAPLDWRAEGSGQGPSLTTDQGGSNLIANGLFPSWSANVPAGWALDSGTAGTHLKQDAANGYFAGGSSALLTGDGATPIQLSQAVSSGSMTSRRRYHVGIAVKASGVTSGTLSLGFAGGADAVAVAASSVTAGWQLLRFHTTMPAPIPTPWKLAVAVTGLNAGGQVWVGSASVAPTLYHGGVGVNVLSGPTPFMRGDRLTFPVTNDQAGKFQDFARRWWRTQWPSVASGSAQGTALTLPFLLMTSTATETLSDSLVA